MKHLPSSNVLLREKTLYIFPVDAKVIGEHSRSCQLEAVIRLEIRDKQYPKTFLKER
jgi:hypothetical protein